MARITGSRITRSASRQASSEASNQSGRRETRGIQHLSELSEAPSAPFGPDGSTQVIPESPENHEGYTNVSGTTLAPNDGDTVHGEYQLGAKITDHLPFIQEQASLVINMLVPQGLNPESIPVEARKLRDASHPNSKRLKRSIQGLTDELQESPLASEGKPLLDTSRLRSLIPPAQFEASIPDVHMTNCALLALVMFSRSGESSQPKVIQDLDELFPLCLMEKISTTPKTRVTGASRTQEETFNIALSIRTQFFIMELERRQSEPDFNPISILRQIFCKEIAPSDDNLHENPGSFRGFHLPGIFEDHDGHLPDSLPEKLQIAVSDRFNDLYEEVSEWDEVDVEGLKKAYRWRSFEREFARWIHTRSREIREDIRRIADKVTNRSPSLRRFTPAPLTTPNLRQTPKATNVQDIPSSQKSRQASMSQGVDETPVTESQVPIPSPVLAASPQKAPAPTSDDQSKKPAQKDPTRRQSRSNYRDGLSVSRLKKRIEGSHQQSNSGTTSRPQINAQAEQTLTSNEGQGTNGLNPARAPTETHEVLEYSGYLGGEDDFTYVNNEDDDDLEYGGVGGVLASTSPSASARINRVSHNPTQLFRRKDLPDVQSVVEDNPASTSESTTTRRLFINKQNDAGRVSPIDDNDTESPNQRQAMPSSANTRKREISYVPSDDSDSDDAFETNTRTFTRRPEKRQRFALDTEETGSGPASGQGVQSSSTQVTSSAGTRRESSDITDGETTHGGRKLPFTVLPGRSAAEAKHFADLNAKAKIDNARKTHERWTEAEDKRFLGLMATFGSHYSAIKKEDNSFPEAAGGPCLAKRTQLQMKDRARTLKKKCIREGLPLPDCLAKINI